MENIGSHWAIVLAAGASQRMGTCKAALPWGKDQNLLTYQLQQFHLAGINPIAVLNPRNAYLITEQIREKVRAIVNPTPEIGKTSSILLGLSQLPPEFKTVIISAVDQPRPANIYQDLLRTWQQNPALIIAPTSQGKIGHPVLFSQRLWPELLTITEASRGLRQVVQKYQKEIIYVPAAEIVLTDLNTPAVYQKAQFQGI